MVFKTGLCSGWESSEPCRNLLKGKPLDTQNICQGAVFAMLACINMYRLIPALLSLAAPSDKRVPLFKPIQRENETIIVHLPNTVLKTIYDANAFFSKCGTSFESVRVSVTL